MRELVTEWIRYLVEGGKNTFHHNVYSIRTGVIRAGQDNETRKFIEKHDFDMAEIMKNAGAYNILSNYKIKEFLGSGGIGAAFSLDEPHENYVMKVQIASMDVGTKNILRIFKKQEAGKFDPRDIRVLDAFSAELPERDRRGNSYSINIFVIAKLANITIAGKRKPGSSADASDFLDDLYETGAYSFLRALSTYRNLSPEKRKDIREKIIPLYDIDNPFGDFSQLYGEKTYDKLIKIAENSTIENVARAIYKDMFRFISYLSRDQFVAMCREYYRQSYLAKKQNRRLDFHGGNFGFRPNSDVPISFDV